ncbi:HAD family hydrolase [Christiangramia forsetii]|uniref:Haloacid dehalogenase-like hydrolase-possibly phosphatase n=2 Tax=Christiangramia forsetii TaxID=411153 RepID=A0LZ17_CHRFK|nr:HAD family phosphatase [Christiangramia forsetii]GGG37187.1 haloacid dehalogenase [Christiangramia forsetii]CAL65612.1 haloacid dehalogenase-like hydrolase-possibly phosphatase [Christiangramia forsetii KT0803]
MIKAILFDFGDVFINLDKEGTNKKLKEMNIKDFPESLVAKNRDYEQGFVTSDEISDHYRTEFPALEKEDFIRSWNAMLLDFPEYRFKFIQKLAEEKDYELILLSNTNENHIKHIQSQVPFFEDFKKCFDAFYLSHEMGMRKPNVEIFEYILNQHNLKAENCLFIDDTLENTEAANKLGFHTWNIEPTREDVIDLFTTKKELF